MRWLPLALLLGGCLSPIVGAECRPGLTPCEGRCVDLGSDPQSCGACGSSCGADEWCIEGACSSAPSDAQVPTLDGGAPSPVDPVIVGGDGIEPLEPTFGTPPIAALPTACDLGELSCQYGCVRADRDPANCGGCGIACAAGERCVAGACAASCEAPLVSCGALCVDTTRDPDHCGGCGVRCDTGVCIDGMCASPLAGHLVVIGHDHTVRRDGMSRVVGNAALLPSRRTVRVLAYEGSATAQSRDGTIAAIDATARETGRAWVHETVDAGHLSYRLAFSDVLLLHAQTDLAPGLARGLGREWRVALRSFLEHGGTVVAIVGPSEPGTLAVLESAGLVGALEDTSALTEITGELVQVVRSSDAVAVGVPLAYRAERASVRLPLDPAAAVVADDVGPVVVHFAITPSDE